MQIDIIKRSKSSIALSLTIIVIGIIMAFVNGGLNLGIDFTGGEIVTLGFSSEFKTEDIQAALNKTDAGESVITRSGTNQAIIRLKSKETEALSQLNTSIINTLQTDNGYTVELVSVERVGAVASQELVINAIMSVAISCLLILLYVWLRFELFSGLSAVLCLLHDVAIMLSFVVIFKIPINSSFIAAILTIIGYSINATILVFDRLRENKQNYGKELSNAELVNKSTSETFWRSVNASLTTFITVFALYIFGVDSIKDFTFPIMIGLVAGAFSSIVLSGQIWHLLKMRTLKASK